MQGVDFHENDEIDEVALSALIREAVEFNSRSARG
jgi:hypothetical protein